MAETAEALIAARELVNRFGDKAVQEAETRVRELENEGQIAACEFWREILKFVRVLSDDAPSGQEH